jgi:hypothetical protein
MFEGFFCAESPFRLTYQASNKVFSGIGDFKPLFAFKFILTSNHSSQNFLIIISIEGWVTAK